MPFAAGLLGEPVGVVLPVGTAGLLIERVQNPALIRMLRLSMLWLLQLWLLRTTGASASPDECEQERPAWSGAADRARLRGVGGPIDDIYTTALPSAAAYSLFVTTCGAGSYSCYE